MKKILIIIMKTIKNIPPWAPQDRMNLPGPLTAAVAAVG